MVIRMALNSEFGTLPKWSKYVLFTFMCKHAKNINFYVLSLCIVGMMGPEFTQRKLSAVALIV